MYDEFGIFKLAFIGLLFIIGLWFIMNNSVEQNNKTDMLITAFQIQNGNLTLEQVRNLTNYPIVVSQLQTANKAISGLQLDLDKSNTIRDSLWSNLNVVSAAITGLFGMVIGAFFVSEDVKKKEEYMRKEKEGLMNKINELENKGKNKK